uniref:Uncharacterized protein n=1 Tax=Lotharella oceanica TaxID=641309 RepID=A0A7S2U4C0_9EUKA
MYGLAWGYVLGLKDKLNIPAANITSHLATELKRNTSPYGFYFATNRTRNYYNGGCRPEDAEKDAEKDAEEKGRLGAFFSDADTWNVHSFTHSAMALYMGVDMESALAPGLLNLHTYQHILNDSWDYRDTTTLYASANFPEGLATPSVNSHYGRQTFFWSLPLALSGQHLDLPRRLLSFNPTPEVAKGTWPVLTPFYSGLMSFGDAERRHVLLRHLRGSPRSLDDLEISVHGAALRKDNGRHQAPAVSVYMLVEPS